jgi:putative endonuclease
MQSASKVKIGRQGETIAAGFLQNRGYDILVRNYTVRGGEIDIIARNAEALVFVEVKSCRTKNFGAPETWVDDRKQQRIGAAADRYLAEHDIENLDCRFDVITIDFSQRPPLINHLTDAFWLEE